MEPAASESLSTYAPDPLRHAGARVRNFDTDGLRVVPEVEAKIDAVFIQEASTTLPHHARHG